MVKCTIWAICKYEAVFGFAETEKEAMERAAKIGGYAKLIYEGR